MPETCVGRKDCKLFTRDRVRGKVVHGVVTLVDSCLRSYLPAINSFIDEGGGCVWLVDIG